MPLFIFLRFELTQHILNKMRWVLTPLVISFIAYVLFGIVLVQARNFSLSANAWDAILAVLTNQRLVLFVLTPLFCYLASDLLPETTFGQIMLLRVGSRQLWWQGKTLALAIMTVSYTGYIILILTAIASIAFPWMQGWSPFALKYLPELGAHPVVFAFPPLVITGLQLTLLGFWWFSLGLLVMMFAQQFQRPETGFLAGIIVNFVVQTIDWYMIFPSPVAKLLSVEHIFILARSSYDTDMGVLAILRMVSYWLIFITIFYILGLRISLRQDFIRLER